jgi:hypothetical protein
LVPSERILTTSISPSEITSSIIMCRSGNRASNHSALARIAWGPFTLLGADCAKGAAACSTKSYAMIGSHTARLFR